MAQKMTAKDALELWRAVTVSTVRDDRPDLTARQQALLLTVYLTSQPHTVRGLSETLGIAKPAVCRALDTLTRLGLVKRKKDTEDLRNVLVQRTVQGSVFLTDFSDRITAAKATLADKPDVKSAA